MPGIVLCPANTRLHLPEQQPQWPGRTFRALRDLAGNCRLLGFQSSLFIQLNGAAGRFWDLRVRSTAS